MLFAHVVVIRRTGADGASFPLTSTRCIFGRGSECDIRIQLPQIGVEHCRLEVNENKEIFLVNLNEAHSVEVNSKNIKGSVRLNHRDVFKIVDRSFRLEIPESTTEEKDSITSSPEKNHRMAMTAKERSEERTSERSASPFKMRGQSQSPLRNQKSAKKDRGRTSQKIIYTPLKSSKVEKPLSTTPGIKVDSSHHFADDRPVFTSQQTTSPKFASNLESISTVTDLFVAPMEGNSPASIEAGLQNTEKVSTPAASRKLISKTTLKANSPFAALSEASLDATKTVNYKVTPRAASLKDRSRAATPKVMPRVTSFNVTPRTNAKTTPMTANNKDAALPIGQNAIPWSLNHIVTPRAISAKASARASSAEATPRATNSTSTPTKQHPKDTPRVTSHMATPRAQTPKTSSRASSAKATPRTPTPNASPRVQSPKVTSVTTSPKATSRVQSPKVTPVTTSPKSSPRVQSPKATLMTTSPKFTPRVQSPKPTPVTTSRKFTPKVQSPTVTPVTTSPKSTPRVQSPKTTPVAHTKTATTRVQSPKVTPSAIPKAIPQAQTPTATTRVQSPEVTWSVSHKATPQAQAPTAIIRVQSPEVARSASPKATPRAQTPTAKPRLQSPEVTPRAISPKSTPRAQTPKTTLRTTSPKSTPKGQDPKTSPRVQSPKATPREQTPKSSLRIQSPKATPRTTSPKSTPRAQTPTASPKSQNPKAIPRSQSLKATPWAQTSAVSPRATSFKSTPRTQTPAATPRAPSPKATPSATSPMYTPWATSPKSTPRAKSPKATPRAQSPKATPWAQSPKATPRAQNPKATPRAQSPKATPRAQSPKATPRAQSPKATPRAQTPKATPRAQSPKATPRAQSPKATPWAQSPKATLQAQSPKTSLKATPLAQTSKATLLTSSRTATILRSTSPTVTPRSTSPKASSKALNSKTLLRTVSPKVSARASSPKVAPRAVSPNANPDTTGDVNADAPRAASPENTTMTINFKASPKALSPTMASKVETNNNASTRRIPKEKSSSPGSTPKSAGRKRTAVEQMSGYAAPSSAKKKRVSFGPRLSPELFVGKLPPATPLRKGGLPPKISDVPASPMLKTKTPVVHPIAGSPIQEESPAKAIISFRSRSPRVLDSYESFKQDQMPTSSKNLTQQYYESDESISIEFISYISPKSLPKGGSKSDKKSPSRGITSPKSPVATSSGRSKPPSPKAEKDIEGIGSSSDLTDQDTPSILKTVSTRSSSPNVLKQNNEPSSNKTATPRRQSLLGRKSSSKMSPKSRTKPQTPKSAPTQKGTVKSKARNMRSWTEEDFNNSNSSSIKKSANAAITQQNTNNNCLLDLSVTRDTGRNNSVMAAPRSTQSKTRIIARSATKSWADIVKQPSMVAKQLPFQQRRVRVPIVKRQSFKPVIKLLPKTPRTKAALLAPSTGHAESPATIVIRKKTVQRTPKVIPRKGRKSIHNKIVRKSAGRVSLGGIQDLFKTPHQKVRKSVGRVSLGGIQDLFKTPHQKVRKSAGRVSLGGVQDLFKTPPQKTPAARQSTPASCSSTHSFAVNTPDSVLYTDIPDTPIGPGEMLVSPLSSKSYSDRLETSMILMGVKELFQNKQPTTPASPSGVASLFASPTVKSMANESVVPEHVMVVDMSDKSLQKPQTPVRSARKSLTKTEFGVARRSLEEVPQPARKRGRKRAASPLEARSKRAALEAAISPARTPLSKGLQKLTSPTKPVSSRKSKTPIRSPAQVTEDKVHSTRVKTPKTPANEVPTIESKKGTPIATVSNTVANTIEVPVNQKSQAMGEETIVTNSKVDATAKKVLTRRAGRKAATLVKSSFPKGVSPTVDESLGNDSTLKSAVLVGEQMAISMCKDDEFPIESNKKTPPKHKLAKKNVNLSSPKASSPVKRTRATRSAPKVNEVTEKSVLVAPLDEIQQQTPLMVTEVKTSQPDAQKGRSSKKHAKLASKVGSPGKTLLEKKVTRRTGRIATPKAITPVKTQMIKTDTVTKIVSPSVIESGLIVRMAEENSPVKSSNKRKAAKMGTSNQSVPAKRMRTTVKPDNALESETPSEEPQVLSPVIVRSSRNNKQSTTNNKASSKNAKKFEVPVKEPQIEVIEKITSSVKVRSTRSNKKSSTPKKKISTPKKKILLAKKDAQKADTPAKGDIAGRKKKSPKHPKVSISKTDKKPEVPVNESQAEVIEKVRSSRNNKKNSTPQQQQTSTQVNEPEVSITEKVLSPVKVSTRRSNKKSTPKKIASTDRKAAQKADTTTKEPQLDATNKVASPLQSRVSRNKKAALVKFTAVSNESQAISKKVPSPVKENYSGKNKRAISKMAALKFDSPKKKSLKVAKRTVQFLMSVPESPGPTTTPAPPVKKTSIAKASSGRGKKAKKEPVEIPVRRLTRARR